MRWTGCEVNAVLPALGLANRPLQMTALAVIPTVGACRQRLSRVLLAQEAPPLKLLTLLLWGS